MSGPEGLLIWTLPSRGALRHREGKCLALGHTASQGRLGLESWFLVSLFCGSLFSLLEGNRWLSESMHLLGPNLPTSTAIFKGCLNLTRPPKALPLPHAESSHQSWTGGVTQTSPSCSGQLRDSYASSSASFLQHHHHRREYLSHKSLVLGHPVIQQIHKAGWLAGLKSTI